MGLGEVQEAAGGRGGGQRRHETDGDQLLRVRGQDADAVFLRARLQVVDEGDAKTRRHDGPHRRGVGGGEAGIGVEIVLGEEAGVVGLQARVQFDEGLCPQGVDGDPVSLRQGMAFRYQHHERSLVDGGPAEGPLPAGGDAEVRPPLPDRLAELTAGALQQVDGDAGVAVGEARDHPAEPGVVVVVGRAHGEGAADQAPELIGALGQQGGEVHHLPGHGQQGLALPGGGHAPVQPGQKGDAQLLLQRRHRPADAGGSVAQFLRRGGETAAVQGPQKDRPFLQIHAHFLLCEKLKDIVLNCRFTQSINCVKTIVKKRSGA